MREPAASAPTPSAKQLAEALRTTPDWALEAMAAALRGADFMAKDFAAAIEAERNQRLFAANEGEETWYAHYPFVQRAKARDLTLPGTWVPVEAKTVEAVFQQGGDLSRVFARYEPRAGQVKMALAVAEALNCHQHLLAEAGTGVGKSLAYLVPCALWACQNNLPIVISTNTRNLQTQLLAKDLPLVQRIVATHLPEGVALRAVVLKGRANYLCLKRFGSCLAGGFERFNTAEAVQFAELVAWAARTQDGDLDSFRPIYAQGDMTFVRSFGCRADECTGSKCPHYRRCFLMQARQAALQAHLVIANHALVFAELSKPGTLLPPHAQIVFDEAHNLENAATQFLSAELSAHTLYDLCQRFAPSKGREAGSLYQQLRKDFIEDELNTPARKVELTAHLAELRKCGVELSKVGAELFESLCEVMAGTPESAVRYRAVPDKSLPPLPDGSAQFRREICLNGRVFQPAETVMDERALCERVTAIKRCLGETARQLDSFLAEISQTVQPAGDRENRWEDLEAAIENAKGSLAEFGNILEAIVQGQDSGMVYWMSRSSTHEKMVSLTAAPLDIARQLEKLLYASKQTLVFSSATLRIHNTFEYLRRRLGLNFIEPQTRVREFVAESPFDYPQQCCVAVPDFLPEVIHGEAYALEFSRLMYQLFVAAQGRSLALFTSYEMMSACAKLLEPHLKAKGIDLLVQSPSLGRDAMTETFRAQSRPTVLFGTQSFWEGVDVVGDALSCVVIARLPFESVADPLLKARCEKIEREGRSSFIELSVPQAVIRFRQGFGRLIRSRSDRGMVVVADSRIVRKNYGRSFADSLPAPVEVFMTRAQVVGRFRKLLGSQSPRREV